MPHALNDMRERTVGTSRYWDRVATGWTGDHPQALWRQHVDSLHRGLLESWLPRARVRRILKTDLFDETAGDGLLAFLGGRAEAVVGMDVAATAVRAACMRNPFGKTLTSDVRWLPFADGVFDIVVSNSTLDHFETNAELVESVAELARVLRPGGDLLITLDNVANPVIALRNALPSRLLQRLGWVRYYVGVSLGPAALRQSLSQVGLDVLDEAVLMHHPSVLAVRLASYVQRVGSAGLGEWCLRFLAAWEVLGRLPTARWTAHYVAARARKAVI